MFNLTIKTPNEEAFNGMIESLSFASENGEMQILEDHASMTTTVVFSPVEIENNDIKESFLVRNGIFLFDNESNSATLLVSYCEKKSEISYQNAKDYWEYIEKMLEEGHELSDFQILYLKGERIAVGKQIEQIEELE